jgi:DNA polymerase elongation subunit (family B)
MFQSIFYDYREKKYHLRDDKIPGWQEFEYHPTFYKPDPKGTYKTLFGESVSPTKKYDPTYYETDVDKETRVLVDFYSESDDTPSYHNIGYFDIECEIAGALTPEVVLDAPTKITSIALYDNTLKQYYCYILDEKQLLKSYEIDNKIIISCLSEKILLQQFLDKWESMDLTIISGWNSAYFDVAYTYSRIAKVLGKSQGERLSPIRKVNINPKNPDYPVKICGLNHLDYMLLFKKFVMKQEPSYALGAIGQKYVKLGKIEYYGSLDTLFKEDVNKFIEYNIRDVEILIALEDKLKFIDLSIIISHLCHTNYENIYYATSLNDGAILTYLKRKNIVSPNKPTTSNPLLKTIEEEYAGGYLKDPIPGLYEWVIDLDFTSLYPSIIRSLNIGIETLVGRIVNNDKYDNQWSLDELSKMDPNTPITVEKLLPDKTTFRTDTTAGIMYNLIKDNNLIISSSYHILIFLIFFLLISSKFSLLNLIVCIIIINNKTILSI